MTGVQTCALPILRERVDAMQPAPQCAGFTYGPQLLKDGAHMEGDMVVVQWEGRRFSVDKADISIKGRHNVYNAMAAILACMRM